MEDALLNGDIYIKRSPKEYVMGDNLKDLIHDLEFELASKGLDDSNYDLLEKLKGLKDTEGTRDFSYTENFWVLMVDSNSISLIYQDPFDVTSVSFGSKQELDKSYIRLIDFLEKAKYVGRYFKRTAPLNEEDDSFMEEDKGALVLYALDDLLLIREILDKKEVFAMVSPLYLEDGNYEFYGEQNNNYRDISALYRAINSQIVESNITLKNL